MWHTVIVTATEWENFFKLRCPAYRVHVNTAKGPEQMSVLYRSKKDLLKSIEEFPQIHEAVSQRTLVQWLQDNASQAEIHIQAVAEASSGAKNKATDVATCAASSTR